MVFIFLDCHFVPHIHTNKLRPFLSVANKCFVFTHQRGESQLRLGPGKFCYFYSSVFISFAVKCYDSIHVPIMASVVERTTPDIKGSQPGLAILRFRRIASCRNTVHVSGSLEQWSRNAFSLLDLRVSDQWL
jgi:hypothetical protein